MKAIVYCEGSTEREFVNKVLDSYLSKKGIRAHPVVCNTSYTRGIAHKGGVSKYSTIGKELKMLCHNTDADIVTTMIDFYGFPSDVPNCRKFIPYISKHEFEALLFSDISAFNNNYPDAVQKLLKIRKGYSSPEEINNSPSTTPSKRILGLIPEYRKTSDGISISMAIGIDRMMDQCPHFRQWIDTIIEMANGIDG